MPPRKTREFRAADLVFAKIKGYPPWPARIEEELPPGFKPTPGRYPVFFFGTYESAVVQAKDIYPYEQYKHQYGIKRKSSMTNFNEALVEIEKTPFITMDSEKIREERTTIDSDNESVSDASFQRSDDSSDNSGKSFSESSLDNKKKSKNGKSKSVKTGKSNNKKVKTKISNDESDSDSDSAVKPKMNIKRNKKQKNGSAKENNKFSKTNKTRKRVKISSESEESKSSVDQSDSEGPSPKNVRKDVISDSDDDDSKSHANKSDKSDEEKVSINNDDSDSDEKKSLPKKKPLKRTKIDSDSDSDDEAAKAKKPKKAANLEKVIKLKHNEKLAQKLEEKEREKERRKREKMEQKRLERIKKTQEADSLAEESEERTIGQTLTFIDQNIKSSLSINNANIEKCLETMESIGNLKITSQEISSCSNQLKELIQTLKKCKKYKADQRVREKADLCLNKFKKLYTRESVDQPKDEPVDPPAKEEECASESPTNEPNLNIEKEDLSAPQESPSAEESQPKTEDNSPEDEDLEQKQDNSIESSDSSNPPSLPPESEC